MARMTREEFEAAVREAINDNVSAETCGCGCGQTVIDGVPDAVKEIGSRFEDAESDAYFAGKDAGVADEIDRNDAMKTGGY